MSSSLKNEIAELRNKRCTLLLHIAKLNKLDTTEPLGCSQDTIICTFTDWFGDSFTLTRGAYGNGPEYFRNAMVTVLQEELAKVEDMLFKLTY